MTATSSVFKPAKHEHLRSRQECGVDLERRVFGGRADEDDVAGLDARQEGVLLRLVEAVNLVDEDNRAAPGRPAQAFGLRHHLADFLDARQHGAERDEPRLRRVGDDPRERRLAGARRPPEDDRLEQVALDRLAQRPAGCQQLLLADEFVEGPRPHPLGERSPGGGGAGRGFFREERIHRRFQVVTKPRKHEKSYGHTSCFRVFVASRWRRAS